eukprot:3292211-Lingulodinium_polyedra.AAC.1
MRRDAQAPPDPGGTDPRPRAAVRENDVDARRRAGARVTSVPGIGQQVRPPANGQHALDARG